MKTQKLKVGFSKLTQFQKQDLDKAIHVLCENYSPVIVWEEKFKQWYDINDKKIPKGTGKDDEKVLYTWFGTQKGNFIQGDLSIDREKEFKLLCNYIQYDLETYKRKKRVTWDEKASKLKQWYDSHNRNLSNEKELYEWFKRQKKNFRTETLSLEKQEKFKLLCTYIHYDLTEIDSTNRASVDYNGMELLVAILISDVHVNTVTELLQKIQDMKKEGYNDIILFNKPEDFNKYVEDICKKIPLIDKYMSRFRASTLDFNFNTITHVYIAGKNNTHRKIQEINKLVEKKSAKSDVYVEYMDGHVVGISVKQSSDATKSNYSIQKILGASVDKQLTDIKRNYLHENNFAQFDKTKRDEVNQLFYSQNKSNPYWRELKREIATNKSLIIKSMVEALFCLNVGYDVYEFEGSTFTKLNTAVDMSTVTFEEHLPYYLKKTQQERKSAKLFYRLIVENKIFRVEIRWKGNVHTSSPQFQIHNDF